MVNRDRSYVYEGHLRLGEGRRVQGQADDDLLSRVGRGEHASLQGTEQKETDALRVVGQAGQGKARWNSRTIAALRKRRWRR